MLTEKLTSIISRRPILAGIGFELRRILETERKEVKASAVIHSLFVSSGPWLIAIITMLILQVFEAPRMETKTNVEITSALVYCFVFSNLFSAPIVNSFIREVSDLLYINDLQELYPSFLSANLILGIWSLLLSYGYLSFFNSFENSRIELCYLFCSLNLLWLSMVMVGAMRSYAYISGSYAFGMCLSLVLIHFYPLASSVFHIRVLTLGFVTVVALLNARVLIEFPVQARFRFDWLLRRDLWLIGVSGFLLYLVFWIDKLVYWFLSSKAQEFLPGFYFYPGYDVAVFLSNFGLIPALAYFTVYVETNFQEVHSEFMGALLSGKNLSTVEKSAQEVYYTFFRCLAKLFIAQLIMGILLLTLLLTLIDFTGLGLESAPLLKICTVNTLLQMIFQCIIIFLYYYDYQWDVFFLNLSTCLIILFLSLFFESMPVKFTGFPYFYGLIAGIALGVWISSKKIKDSLYYLLMANDY